MGEITPNGLRVLVAQHERNTVALMRLVSQISDLELTERIAIEAAELPELRQQVCGLSEQLHQQVTADATAKVSAGERRIGERRVWADRRRPR
jgi:hypothetical protein